MTTTAKISLHSLLLDGNNPRFEREFSLEGRIADSELVSQQEALLAKFSTDGKEEDGFHDISDLKQSLSEVGFIPVDRVVVRKTSDSDSFVVIEGNRRVATMKLLLDRDQKEKNPQKKLSSLVKESFDPLPVQVLQTDGLTESEVQHEIDVLLGIRHFEGAILTWEPIARAFNILHEYLDTEPKQSVFRFENKRKNTVAAQLAIKEGIVRDSCLTYLAYQQLEAADVPVKPRHFSLIEALMKSKKLTGQNAYIYYEPESFALSESSIERIARLCQFGSRDTPSPEGKQKVLADPKDVKRFALVYDYSRNHSNPAVAKRAEALMAEIEAENLSADRAESNLRNFEKQIEWVDSISEKLSYQENRLPIATFQTEGNALIHLQEVQKQVRKLSALLDL